MTVAVRSLPELDEEDLDRVIGREHGVDGHERHQDTRRDEDPDLRVLGHRRGASDEVLGQEIDGGREIVEEEVGR